MHRIATTLLVLLALASAARAQTRVLVDGQYPAALHSYAESGALFGDILADWGFSVEVNADQALDALDLGQYDAVVISVLWSCYTRGYTAGEVQAIADYVTGGGGLLLMYETPGFGDVNLAPVSSLFGVTLVDWATDRVSPVITHPVTANLDYALLIGPGVLQVASPSVAALVDDIARPVVAVGETDRLVVVADTDWVLDDNAQPRTRILLVNIMRWLAGTPTATAPTTWSDLKALYAD